jgi:hypothetical protein
VERRAGQLLSEAGFGEHGGDRKSSFTMKLEDLSIGKMQNFPWQLEGSVPETDFERYLAKR